VVSLNETGEEELLDPVGQVFIGPALKSTVQAGVEKINSVSACVLIFWQNK